MINRQQENCIPYWQMNIIFHTTSIWTDMTFWTRSYVFSAANGSENQEEVFGRLYRIPSDFAETFQLIFGGAVATRYSNLLSNQIIILREIINAQVRGDANAVNENTTSLYQNADGRAAYLAQINPYWQEAQWRSLIYSYLSLTLNESTRILARDYANAINMFDSLMSSASQIGDYFSQGLFNYLSAPGAPAQSVCR